MSERLNKTEAPSGFIQWSPEAARHIQDLAIQFKTGLMLAQDILTQKTDEPSAIFVLRLSQRSVEIGVGMGASILTEEHVDLAAKEIAGVTAAA